MRHFHLQQTSTTFFLFSANTARLICCIIIQSQMVMSAMKSQRWIFLKIIAAAEWGEPGKETLISRSPQVLLAERTWSSTYCSISESNVLKDNRVSELIQSTGDLVIMNQYICIMQKRSLCSTKARHIHSSRLLWKPRSDITQSRHVDPPVFIIRKLSQTMAGPFPVKRERVIDFALYLIYIWTEAKFPYNLQPGSVSLRGLLDGSV